MVPNLDYKKDAFLESSLISNFLSNTPTTTSTTMSPNHHTNKQACHQPASSSPSLSSSNGLVTWLNSFLRGGIQKPLSRCGECSCLGDREDALEYADQCSEGPYHPPKVAEENAVPLPIPEPTLLVVDQSCPPSDQENLLPCAMTPPPLNVLIPIMEEELPRVNDCC